jgi:6-phosphofructokinase 1
MKKIRIGILTGGGDCAGLNPAIKWIVNSALDSRIEQEYGIKFEILGIKEGWKGLLFADPSCPECEEYTMSLDQITVGTWDRYGGTNLGTSRTNPYNAKNNQSKQVLENIKKAGIDVVIAIGGEDTLSVAAKLSLDGVNVIGIPKTIDKDLAETEYSLGFETAINVIVEEIDRLRTTASSHGRVFVVEIMGREAGWLALEGGELSGADIILIPEHDFDMKKVNQIVKEKKDSRQRYQIVMAAEGAKPVGGSHFTSDSSVDSFGHVKLGGIAEYVANAITEGTGIETRSVVLSHLQRGGTPCAYDRRMGRYFGIAAVDLIIKGNFGRMVALKDGKITSVPIENEIGKISQVDIKKHYDTERYNGRRHLLLDDSSSEILIQ